MARITLLSTQLLDAMLADPNFRQFPCLATPPRLAVKKLKRVPARGCGGCKRSRREVKVVARAHGGGSVDYNALKLQLIALPAKQRDALKTLLNCTGLKVQYRSNRKAVERRVI